MHAAHRHMSSSCIEQRGRFVEDLGGSVSGLSDYESVVIATRLTFKIRDFSTAIGPQTIIIARFNYTDRDRRWKPSLYEYGDESLQTYRPSR